MESKQAHPAQSKKHYPTVLGAIFVPIFNVILLSVLAWISLTMWFFLQVILSNGEKVRVIVQGIVDNQHAIITHYHSAFLSLLLKSIQNLQHTVNFWCEHYIGWNIAAILMGTFEIALTRFCLFAAFLPLISAILFILSIDGLVQRDKRKFQGARESTFLFHRLKPMAQFSFFSLFFLYMVIPLQVSPEVCLIPMMILSGLFMMLAIKSFKKYL
jgi:integrating conjugative element membrane protein (TIGR03747 family)